MSATALSPPRPVERWMLAVRTAAPTVPPVLRVMVAVVLSARDLDADSLLSVADGLTEEAALQDAGGEPQIATELRILADMTREHPPSRVVNIRDDFA